MARLCGSRNTFDGKPCRNKADTCPHVHQGISRQPQSASTSNVDLNTVSQGWSSDIQQDIPGLSLPGVGIDAPGLAGNPKLFAELSELAHKETGTDQVNLVRDYWLTFCLRGIVNNGGTNSIIQGGQGKKQKPIAIVAFSGGTSLVSAWRISERYSEDLDVLALMLDKSASPSARKRPLSIVTKWVANETKILQENVTVEHFGEAGHRRTYLGMGGESDFLKLETTVEDDGDGIWETHQVMSLMGRFATQEQLADYPELGGFEMPVVTPAYTAANKFDALHRRAMTGKFRGITARGRDLYDLAMIALSIHGEDTRRAVPMLAERATEFLGHRQIVPRPPGGYVDSPVFAAGTEANNALRAGYEAVGQIIWGNQPPFGEAIELAAWLDGG